MKLTVGKSAAAVAAPAANALTYTGGAQTLVSAGGDDLLYALGYNGANTPETFSTAVPSAVEAGTYYVWYRAAGNANRYASAPACIPVTIASRESIVRITGSVGDGGKLTDVQTAEVSGDARATLTMKGAGAAFKLMLVDKTDYAPLCAAWNS